LAAGERLLVPMERYAGAISFIIFACKLKEAEQRI